MKKKIALPLLSTLILMLWYSCAEKNFVYRKQVSALQGGNEGEINLRATGYGTNEAEAVLESEKNAFEAILFTGITGSQQSRPLIDNEQESKAQHSKFYKEFLENRGYNQFVINSTHSGLHKVKKNFVVTSDVKINLFALRSYLEQQGVIRKFGW